MQNHEPIDKPHAIRCFIFQKHALYPRLTIGEYEGLKKRIAQALDMVGITGFEEFTRLNYQGERDCALRLQERSL